MGQGGIGRRLETAREARGLSLREAEERTRIRSRYLRDLERENFDVLPAVYVLGSLKTYADFLGLDGAALSGEVKDRLAEPAGPDILARPAALEDAEEGDRRPGILPAASFDQLFLGAGVIMISILAIMTLVAAVAQEDQSPISEINEPSTPETPSGIALAGTVEDGTFAQSADDTEKIEQGGGDGRERPRTSKEDEAEDDRDNGEGSGEADDRGDPGQDSVFGDVEFVRMSPASPRAQPEASASASPAPAAGTASDRGASPGPSSDASATSSVAAGPAPQASASGNASPGTAVGAAPSRTTPRGGAVSGPQAGVPARPAFDSQAGRISAGVDRAVGQAFAATGIER